MQGCWGGGNQPVMCRILLGWMEAEQPRLVQPEGMKLLPRATEQSLPLPWEGIALGWGAKRSPVPLLQPGRSRASPPPPTPGEARASSPLWGGWSSSAGASKW